MTATVSIADLVAHLRLDAQGFTKGVYDADKALANLKGGIERASTLLAGMGGVLAAAGFGAVKAASTWNETTNVIQVAFGKNAAAAEKWAAASGQAMGRSTQQMREFAGTFQSMLAPMTGSVDKAAKMSTTFAQLAVDIGSFRNVSDKEAFTALSSAIAGEIEPMKRFGVVMSVAALDAYALEKGINKTTQQMSEAEKTNLRYNFVLDRTSMMHGDAEKTADSFANQMKALEGNVKNAATTIGNTLLPVATSIVGTFNDWTKSLTDMSTEEAAMVKFFGAMAMGIGLVTAALLKLSVSGGMAAMGAVVAAAPVLLGVTAVGMAGAAGYYGIKNTYDTGGVMHGRQVETADYFREQAAAGKYDRNEFGAGGLAQGKDAMKYKGLTEDEERSAITDGAIATGNLLAKKINDEMARVLKAAVKDYGVLGGAAGKAGADDNPWTAAELKAIHRQSKAGKKKYQGSFSDSDIDRSVEEWQGGSGSTGAQVVAPFNAAAQAVTQFGKASDKSVAASEKRDADLDAQHARKKEKENQRMNKAVDSGLAGVGSNLLGGNIAGAVNSGISAALAGLGNDSSFLSGAAGAVVGLFSKAAEFTINAIKGVVAQGMVIAKTFLPTDARVSGALGAGTAGAGAVMAASLPLIAPMMTALFGPIGTALTILVPLIAGAGMGLLDLMKQTKSYGQFQAGMSKGVDKIVAALEPAFAQLLPLAGLFIQAAGAVGIMIRVFIPGVGAAGAAFRAIHNVGMIAMGTAIALATAREAILTVASQMFDLVSFMTKGKADENDRFHQSREAVTNELNHAGDDVGALRTQRDEFQMLDPLAAAALATAEALDKLTRSTTNMPTGYRVDVAAARAQDPNAANGGMQRQDTTLPGGRSNSAIAGPLDAIVRDLAEAAARIASEASKAQEYVKHGVRVRAGHHAAHTRT